MSEYSRHEPDASDASRLQQLVQKTSTIIQQFDQKAPSSPIVLNDEHNDYDDNPITELMNEYSRACQANKQLVDTVTNLQSINGELVLYTQRLLMLFSELHGTMVPALPESLVNASDFSSPKQSQDNNTTQTVNEAISALSNLSKINCSDEFAEEEEDSFLYDPIKSEPQSSPLAPTSTLNPQPSESNEIVPISSTQPTFDISDATKIFQDSLIVFSPFLRSKPKLDKNCVGCSLLQKTFAAFPALSNPNSITHVSDGDQNSNKLTDFNDLIKTQEDFDHSMLAMDISAMDVGSRILAPSVYANHSMTKAAHDADFQNNYNIFNSGNMRQLKQLDMPLDFGASKDMQKIWEDAENEFSSRFLEAYHDPKLFSGSNTLSDDSKVENVSPTSHSTTPRSIVSPKNNAPMVFCSGCHKAGVNEVMCETETASDRSLKHSLLRFALWAVIMSTLAIDMFSRVRTSYFDFHPM